MNELFNKLNEHFGFGNPNNAIWFVGIEEAGVWTKAEFKKTKEKKLKVEIDKYTDENYIEDVIDTIDTNYKYISDDKKYSYFGDWDTEDKRENYYNNISKICAKLNNIDDWLSFKHKYLCKKNKGELKFNTFITNLYPLGFKRITDWENDYKLLFEFKDINSKEEFYEYIKSKTKRFKKLHLLWQKSEPIATVCTGKSRYWDFLKCFNKLDNKENWNNYKNPKYRFYKEDKFFIVNHLSYNSYFGLFMKENYGLLSELIKQS